MKALWFESKFINRLIKKNRSFIPEKTTNKTPAIIIVNTNNSFLLIVRHLKHRYEITIIIRPRNGPREADKMRLIIAIVNKGIFISLFKFVYINVINKNTPYVPMVIGLSNGGLPDSERIDIRVVAYFATSIPYLLIKLTVNRMFISAKINSRYLFNDS